MRRNEWEDEAASNLDGEDECDNNGMKEIRVVNRESRQG